MIFSNTAVPKYYGQFRDAVMRGEIPVNNEVSLEMNRIDELIADPDFYYDEAAVEGWIAFCEDELTLTDGADLNLLDSFKLWGEQALGWYYFSEKEIYEPDGRGSGAFVIKTVKRRLTLKQYLIVARGAAKTMYLATIQAYFQNVDTSTTHQITTAPTMKQGEEVLSPLRTAIARAKGPLFDFLTEGSLQNTTGRIQDRVKLTPTKKGIENRMTGSLIEIKPMRIAKLQGLRTKLATVDEWLSCEIKEDPIGAIEQGASKIEDYLIIAASSEGTIRNGVGDTIKLELMDILKGDYYAPHISIWYYKLDDLDEINYPELWPKANPNIGITVSYEAYQLDVARAEKAPAARNDILAKRFGIPMEGYTYYFPFEETFLHPKKIFKGMDCALGIDLSMGDDFCAFTFLFPLKNGCFGVKTINYITYRTYRMLPAAMRLKYDQFIAEGTLVVMETAILDFDEVYEDVEEFILKNEYNVLAVGYDPYGAEQFMERWVKENSSFGVSIVRQGSKTESIPLGEIKTLSEERMLLFDQEIMSFTMGNCVVLQDTNGNRKLYKQRQDQKIDSVAALMDAYVAYKRNKEEFE